MIWGLLLGKFLMQYNKLNKTTKCFPCWLTKKCVSVYSQHLNIWLANAYVKWHTTRHTKNLSMSVMNRDHYRLANLYFRLLKGRRLLVKKNLTPLLCFPSSRHSVNSLHLLKVAFLRDVQKYIKSFQVCDNSLILEMNAVY